MRILIESTLDYRNMGDLAMLKVCLLRLRAIWPEARIMAFTSDPESLAVQCPGVDPVFQTARELWFGSQPQEDPLSRRVLDDFLQNLRATDLFVVAGMGSYTSTFQPDVFYMFETIALMKSFGISCAAFSQGIGPIEESSETWRIAQRTLPLLDFIALREGLFGPSLLDSLGLPPHRLAVTGDDAIELAYHESPLTLRNALGVCLRVTAYSGVSPDDVRNLGYLLRKIAERVNASILAVPISHVNAASDLEAFSFIFPDSDSPAQTSDFQMTPEWVIEEIGRCRVVVCGAYHAAVFALSQGIPAVCLAKSEYYRQKFLGLASQFGDGCRVLSLLDRDIENTLAKTVEELWHTASLYREPLLSAARRQISLSKAAWAELPTRLPLTHAGISRPVPVNDVDGQIRTWYQYRTRMLAAQLRECLDYLKKVEEARDWHRARAERFEEELRRIRGGTAAGRG